MQQQIPGAARPAVRDRLALLLRRHRPQAIAVLALALLGWGFLAWTVIDMEHPLAQLMMPMSARWSPASALAILAMWAIMMAAMMLPSALPMVLQFVDLAQRNGEPVRGWVFVGAYLVAWLLFSVLAATLQWGMQFMGWIDPMAASRSAVLTGCLLLLAGIYQFSPLKRVCLTACRTPVGFLLGQWRSGLAGAFAMGWRHGLFCLGCCWALMVLLFVGGVMNLPWVAALAIAVALEKMLPRGDRLATGLGAILILLGLVRLVAMWS